MAIYIYTYSGFPEDRSRKFYVCNFRKGRAHTYQVVPQLQRMLERRYEGDKTELEWEQFKEWRRAGFLYTENRSGRRSPLFEAVGPAADDGFERLVEWIGGEASPGEVDWFGLGRQLRRALQRGDRLPTPLRSAASAITTERGTSMAEEYAAIRRMHLRRVWFHHWRSLTLGDLADVPGRSFETERSACLVDEPSGSEGETPTEARAATAFRLHELVRESRPARAPIAEEDVRAALAEALGGEPGSDWEELFDDLGFERAWYDEQVGAGGEVYRVPSDALYEAQWVLDERLEEVDLHHSCATSREVERPEALHARFHAGARAAVTVEIAKYPRAIDRDLLASELEVEAEGGLFAGWSERGIRALVRLLVDPSSGRVSAASPSTEWSAESALWPLDDRLRTELDASSEVDSGWRYSRLRDEIVISAPDVRSPGELSTVVGLVSDALAGLGLELADGGTSMWKSGDRPLTAGGLVVPRGVAGEVRPKAPECSKFRSALDRALQGSGSESDVKLLQKAYKTTGDLRHGTLGHPDLRRHVRSLLESLTLSEFESSIREGWFSQAGE